MIPLAITSIYLGTTCGTLWCLGRYRFHCREAEKNGRLLLLFASGHALAVASLYLSGLSGGFFTMCAVMGFPLIGLVIWRLSRKTNFPGILNILYLGVLLSSVGLLMHYRVGLRGARLMGLLKIHGGVPVAINMMLFTLISLAGISYCVFSGRIAKWLSWVEGKTYAYWGVVALIALSVPLFTGFAVGRTKAWLLGSSFQITEFGLKLLFPAFLAAFLHQHRKELSSPGYPAKEIGRILIVLLGLLSCYFFLPMMLAKELGTPLIIGLCLVATVTYATGRWYIFPVGLLLLAMAMFGGTLVDSHIRERVFGSWWEWENYVRRVYTPGSSRLPGWQISQIRALLESASIYGRGLGQGNWGHISAISTDFAITPVLTELGVVGLCLILGCYLLFVYYGIPSSSERDFRRVLQAGTAVILATQGCFNVIANLGIVPLAGVPAPFISSGGSAAICNIILLGLLTELGRPREIRLAGNGHSI